MLTLEDNARNAKVDGLTALVNSGKLEICEGSTVLATVTLHSTAFGSASSGTATAIGGDNTNPISSGNPRSFTGAATGAADNFKLRTSGDALVLSGSVTATGGGGDATINNVNIAADQGGFLNTLSYTQPASAS
jgi:hypothetical protein